MNLTINQLTAMVRLAVDIAGADGEMSEKESSVITHELNSFNVSDEQFSSIISEARDMKFITAATILQQMETDRKCEACGFLAAVACIDGNVDAAEFERWQSICKWCEFPSMTMEEALRFFTGEAAPSSVQRRDFNGGYYEGEMTDGLYEGRGVLCWDDGQKYVGDFKKGKRTGIGTYTWPGGAKYVGEFVDGRMHGRGKYFYANGDVYDGLWADNTKSGFGLYTYASGSKEYGEYKDDNQHGFNLYVNKDGEVHVQEFVSGKKTSDRTYKFPPDDNPMM